MCQCNSWSRKMHSNYGFWHSNVTIIVRELKPVLHMCFWCCNSSMRFLFYRHLSKQSRISFVIANSILLGMLQVSLNTLFWQICPQKTFPYKFLQHWCGLVRPFTYLLLWLSPHRFYWIELAVKLGQKVWWFNSVLILADSISSCKIDSIDFLLQIGTLSNNMI